MAQKKEIQNNLFDEFNLIKNELNGKNLTCDSLNKMKYFDTVIDEGLRMCPIATELHRRATKRYTLIGKNDISVPIKIGDAIWIPMYTIHMDEKYFESPNEFNPERFNEVNRKNIIRGTYAPFGIGPRDCIGCRYTVAELKTFFYYVCLNFTIDTCSTVNEDELKLTLRD